MKDWRFLFEKYVLGQHDSNKFPEPEVLRFLKQIHGWLFIDIGANVGIYDIALAKNFATFYAFEPNPQTLVRLKENLARAGKHYTIFPLALTNLKGRTAFYLDPHRGFSGSADTILPVFEYRPNLVPKGGRDFTYVGKQSVQVETDTYDNVIDGQIADLVKIDVEGAEFLVLQGMVESLKGRKVKRVMVELHNRDRHGELESLLSEAGFQTVWLDVDRVFGELEGVEDSLMPYRTV